MMIDLKHGDCLELMKDIPSSSVDAIICDLPYGTTACAWDVVISFDKLWEQYKRIVKDNGAIVLFGQEPFSSHLRLSNIQHYKYDWYWKKSRPSGFTNAKLKPLKDIETISVFSKGMTANGSIKNMTYIPQGLEKCNIDWSRPKIYMDGDRGVNPTRPNSKLNRKIKNTGYPRQILEFSNSNNKVLHPTQKPVALMEYLIKTYSNEGETVLDNCMGSGTTGVACLNNNRSFIGIEMDKIYFDIASSRINEVQEKVEVLDEFQEFFN